MSPPPLPVYQGETPTIWYKAEIAHKITFNTFTIIDRWLQKQIAEIESELFWILDK